MPWLDDLVTLLEGAGAGTFNQDLFVSTRAHIPLLPSGEATIQVISTGGSAPEFTNTRRTSETDVEVVLAPAYAAPAAQIVTRADDFATAEAKAFACYDAVTGVRNTYINSGWYRSIKPLQDPFDGGLDQRGQSRVVFNILGDKRP